MRFAVLLGLACAAALAVALRTARSPTPLAAPATAVPARAVAQRSVYPLRPSANRRYLVDQRNVPILIVGDSPQAMTVNLSVEQAADFLADRRAAGFNAVWVNLLTTTGLGGRPDGSTYDGVAPFKVEGDLSTPNEAFFSRVDRMIRLAAGQNITVFLNPIETIGWLGVLRSNGRAKAFSYGRYLGRRYRKFPNIVWFNGNDFQTWPNPADDGLALAVARGIAAADPNHIQTIELNYYSSGSLDDKRWAPLIGLDAAYTYYPTYAQLLKEYGRRRFLPTVMVEANYEWEHDYTGPQSLRRQEYWSLLSGTAGQFYGNKYTWLFLKEWQSHLDTTGTRQLAYVTKLVAGRPWFRLIPDRRHRVVTGGYGTYASRGSVNASDYVTAASTPDGRLAIAYLPRARPVIVDMRTFRGPVRARWYDPTRGTYTAISSAPFENSGQRGFTPPERNGDGESDWVLVLTARR